MTTRRLFLKYTGGGMAVAVATPAFALANAPHTGGRPSADSFKLGLAGFNFLHFKLEQALEMMKKVDVHSLCIKDFHLPLTSTAEQVAAFHETLKNAGVTGYAVGPIYMKSPAEIDNAFDYARRVGVKLMIGIPNPEDLPYVEKKVKESDIRFAIHNHGPDGLGYPNAVTIYGLIKNLDPRVGICLDIGHDIRYGNDPIADMKKYAPEFLISTSKT